MDMQRDEITSHLIYLKLSQRIKNEHNKKVLRRIADDEMSHYNLLKINTQVDVKPNKFKVAYFFWIAKLFGITFGVKLMERSEEKAQLAYEKVMAEMPEIKQIIEDEDRHEQELIGMIEEESLNYVGSVVLGLNDALVELTGALAGFSFALQNTRLIAIAGIVTGVSATLSMAASEYLSKKSEGEGATALKSSIYTGIAYLITVGILILPYLILDDYRWCLAFTILSALFIILVFNYYISVAKDLNFKQRFIEMALISLTVAAISFGIAFVLKQFVGIEI